VNEKLPSSLVQRMLAAVVMLLVVSAAARIVWWLLEPLLPWLIAAACLISLYLVVFGWLRRR
jgi:hypothetical protein